MKKIIILFIGLFIFSGYKDKSKDIDKIEKELNKNVKIEIIRNKAFVKNTISSGLVEPLKEVDQITDTGGEIIKINHKNGDRVKKDDIILVLRDQNINSAYIKAKADYISSKSDYETKIINFKKITELYQDQFVSEDEYLNIKNKLNQSLSNFKRAETSYIYNKENYENLTMKAKISGMVTDMDQQLYKKLNVKDKVFTIIDDKIMRIKTGVSDSEINTLQIGAKAYITLEGIENIYIGNVYEINPVADPKTRKYEVKIKLNNKDKKFKKGMYSNVVLETGKKIGYLVPKEAIITRDLFSYIFIINEEKAKMIKIKRGSFQGNYQEIINKFLPKVFKIVIDGQFFLEDGEKVKILK